MLRPSRFCTKSFGALEPLVAQPTTGEGSSSITSDEKYLEGACRGLRSMLKPVQKGGNSRPTEESFILEECPRYQPNTVLNGWISALFGIYDVLLEVVHVEAHEFLQSSLRALIMALPKYDAGYWSLYDSSGSLSSPYYHRVHIVQLRALELTFSDQATVLRSVRTRFEKQLSSSLCRTKAFLLKVFQKLRQPPVTVLIQSKAS